MVERRVEVIHLGVIDYQQCLDMMKELQQKRMNDQIVDTLLLLEHPEIVTVGPRARNDGIAPPEGYANQPVDRGGGLTWHGPGQIVAYPIFKWNLEGENSVATIIELIEAWIIAALKKCGIHSQRDSRMQGVWVKGYKISSIGLSFLRWTSRHGFTINIDTPQGRVEGLAGCGLNAETTTCLNRLGHAIERQEVIQTLLETMEVNVSRSPE